MINKPIIRISISSKLSIVGDRDEHFLDNNFEIAIKTVQTTSNTSYGQNTTLRLKNLNSVFSPGFKDVITQSDKPVVMSGGIFSNLESFENGLAGELTKK